MPHFVRRRGSNWRTPRLEVRHLPPEEQRRLVTAAAQQASTDWLCRLLACAIFVLIVCLCLLPASLERHLAATRLTDGLPFDPELLLVLGAPLCVGVLGGLLIVRSRRVVGRALREQMLAEGIRTAVCFECGYYTEGFEGNECPNCEAALVAPSPTPSGSE